MQEPPTPSESSPTARGKRLESWKQIAAYLNRGVTTVQRWEADSGLPVHRLSHAKRGSVFAYEGELDHWLRSRTLSSQSVDAETPSPETTDAFAPASRRSPRRVLLGASLALVTLAGVAAWVSIDARSDLQPSPRPRVIASEEGREGTPTLSPDGRRIAYYWDRRDGAGIFVKRVGDSVPQRLDVGGLTSVRRPRWSPRGDLIAFLTFEPNEVRGVWVVPVDGPGTPRRLTTSSGVALCWAPDGRTLAFVDRNAVGEPLSIYRVSLETGQRERVTVPPSSSFGDTDCAFASDGRLAVVRHFTRYQSDICVVDPRDGTTERMTNGAEGITGITWTLDDAEIVYGNDRGLWRVGTGSPARLLLRTGAGLLHPTFSRESPGAEVRLAFESRSTDVNLWSWSADSAAARSTVRLEGSPVWDDHAHRSPDGRRLAFVSNRSGTPEVWISAADGSDARQVTFNRGPPAMSPRWSPDGQRLAYSSMSAGNQDIYSVALDGTRATRLTWEASQEENPTWSRDGRWIYFRSDRGGVGQIWRTLADGGGGTELVTRGEASQALESPDRRTLYFVRQAEAPGLWSMSLSGCGRETLVASHVRESLWDVTDSALMFIVTDPVASPDGPTLQMLSLPSGRTTTLAILPAAGTQIMNGLTVSRDGRSAIWARLDRLDADLMLIDGWKP